MSHTRTDVIRYLNDRLDWNLLRTFLVIMQERSLSRAAARLHLTQPAISLALKRLEEAVGHSLIQRRGQQFKPTPAGEEVFRTAGEIYGHLSRLETELAYRGEDITGSVRMLSVSRMDAWVYDEFLAEFHRSYPRVDIQIEVMRSSDIVLSLLQMTATAGLAVCRTPQEKLEQRCFLRQRYAIFCGRHHPLFGRQGLSLEDLRSQDFVSFTTELLGESLSPISVFRDQNGFMGDTIAVSSSLDEIRRLIFAGYGIGCLPEHIVRDDILSQRLWRLPPDDGVADIDIQFLWHRGRKMNPAERMFLEGMERTMQRHPLQERLGPR